MKRLIKYIKELFAIYFVRRSSYKCNCGDENCKREVKVSSQGRMYVINHFTCGKIKSFINKYKDCKYGC